MISAIKKYLGDFAAIIALVALGIGVAGYIIVNQDARPPLPLLEPPPKTIEAEFTSGHAVVPGQGQTVRVAGVQIGKIQGVRVDDGLAVVEMAIEGQYENLVRQDASALLRPRTGLKDMFVELDPGTKSAPVMPAGGRISVENTAPDVDPDEILAALDTDTRAYLKLLVNGAGQGLRNNGDSLNEVFKRFLPLHRDLKKVQGAFAARREALRQLVHNYGVLTEELARNDDALEQLVVASEEALGAFAAEDENISAAVARLPSALSQTEETLVKVDALGEVLGPTLDDLRPAIRRLCGPLGASVPRECDPGSVNRAVLPLVRQGTPIVRDQIRPFVRQAQPYVSDVRPAARQLAAAVPDLTTAFGELNRFFNMLAFNPAGHEEADDANPRIGNTESFSDPNRDEGYLFWLAWVVNNSVSLHSASDAEGPVRRGSFSLNCQTLQTLLVPLIPKPLREALAGLGDDAEAVEDLLNAPLPPDGRSVFEALNDELTGGAVPPPGPFADALLKCVGLGAIDFTPDAETAQTSEAPGASTAPEGSSATVELDVKALEELEELAGDATAGRGGGN